MEIRQLASSSVSLHSQPFFVSTGDVSKHCVQWYFHRPPSTSSRSHWTSLVPLPTWHSVPFIPTPPFKPRVHPPRDVLGPHSSPRGRRSPLRTGSLLSSWTGHWNAQDDAQAMAGRTEKSRLMAAGQAAPRHRTRPPTRRGRGPGW